MIYIVINLRSNNPRLMLRWAAAYIMLRWLLNVTCI